MITKKEDSYLRLYYYAVSWTFTIQQNYLVFLTTFFNNLRYFITLRYKYIYIFFTVWLQRYKRERFMLTFLLLYSSKLRFIKVQSNFLSSFFNYLRHSTRNFSNIDKNIFITRLQRNKIYIYGNIIFKSNF